MNTVNRDTKVNELSKMEIIFSFFLIREQTRSLLQLINQLQTINLSEGWIKLFL